ncbi:unnamed protein product [Didymodactylos carnosus]|uniref:Uncharacterized protein n=1 Tax=Didymodactylos carnosus TaxID=1234261 RepID=A0A813Y943_9BILA|nr:unnamed protein product [Didymodactylos carnosus]CAF3667050.1 unnamed protein product [Didymodactylos carnosus]
MLVSSGANGGQSTILRPSLSIVDSQILNEICPEAITESTPPIRLQTVNCTNGSSFELITDYSALQWLFDFNGHNKRL